MLFFLVFTFVTILAIGIFSWVTKSRQEIPLVPLSLNTAVRVEFDGIEGTLSVGNECVFLCHPSIKRNFYRYGQIQKVTGSRVFGSLLALTCEEGEALRLVTPLAKELKALILEQKQRCR